MISFPVEELWGSKKTRVEWWERATLHFSSKFQLTVYLLYSLFKRSDVKQSEEKNVAPAMLFDVYIF